MISRKKLIEVALRAEHEDALVEVQSRIERALPGIDQTARIKTIQPLLSPPNSSRSDDATAARRQLTGASPDAA